MTVGRICSLWRYPFKSMQGESLPSARLGPRGIAGDRGWAAREPGGRLGSAKRLAPLLLCAARLLEEPAETRVPAVEVVVPDGRRVRAEDAAAPLSELCGRPLDVAYAAGAHFDDLPLHLLTEASLSALRARATGPDFDARRFRPNVLVAAPGDGFVEQAWVGRRLRVGEALLEVAKGTSRCVMTTHPQPGLPAEPEILRAVAREAAARLGVYATVLTPGLARVGDAVALV